MDSSRRQAVEFLEKELKTYKALALFLSKEEARKHASARALPDPPYYKERMRQARNLLRALRKSA